MSVSYPNLFSPISIRGHIFKNRILSAPLGAWVFSPDNYLFDYAISTFEEKARGGAAAVCVGHTEVHYKDADSDGFGLYFDLRKPEGTCAATIFAQSIQQYGCHASIELNYGGIEHGEGPGFPGQKETYNIYRCDGPVIGKSHPMTREKLQEIKENYVRCIEKMRQVGFHMVTIHGAHGWMLHQFLSKHNQRSDEYGGSLENRMRFPLELMQAVREAAGPNMIVEYRISGVSPLKNPEAFEEQIAFLNRLEGLADLIHISAGGDDGPTSETFPSYFTGRGIHRDLARAIKPRVPNIPIAVVGAISDPEMAEEIIAQGEADFVAMCRTLIADPQWPNKAQRGQEKEIRPCLACYNCLDQMHLTHFIGCDINPRCGMEHRLTLPRPSAAPQNVLIVGGGPAGMAAACTASDCGHHVTLVEKQEALGGLLRLSDGDPVKWMLNRYKNYLVHQVEKRPIQVLLNTEATPDLIASLQPDSVLVAAGSEPVIPSIPGADAPHVFTCTRLHAEREKMGRNIVIIGGNMVGCEEALTLKTLGAETVTVLEMTDTLHADAGMVAPAVAEALAEKGVHTVTHAKCTRILEDAVLAETPAGLISYPCDSVLLAVGMRACFAVYESLRLCAPYVQAIGDCVKPATIRNAVRNAYYTAQNLT